MKVSPLRRGLKLRMLQGIYSQSVTYEGLPSAKGTETSSQELFSSLKLVL